MSNSIKGSKMSYIIIKEDKLKFIVSCRFASDDQARLEVGFRDCDSVEMGCLSLHRA